MYAKKNSNKKLIAVLLAVALLVGGAVGGTVAWLVTGTETITNTFTVGDINITLKETVNKDAFNIVPGTSEKKDPVITVEAGSEDCYVFVEVVESNNTATSGASYVTWEIADGWTELETGVYFRCYTSGEQEKYSVLKNDQVSYSSELTKAQLDELGENKPTLVFTGYAVQMANSNNTSFEPADAWDEIK